MRKRHTKTADERLRDQLAAAKATVQTKDQIIAAQQGEIEQMRAMLTEMTAAKPGRPFRTRKLIVDRLDVIIKGTDITEDEVLIEHVEHVGGYLAIRVGNAIGSFAGVQPREVFRYTAQDDARAVETAGSTAVRPTENLMLGSLRALGVPSVAAIDPTGGAGDDPTIINANLAPQGDPRIPGGHQLPPDREVVAGYDGYDGRGQRPAGWKDRDAAEAETAN